MSQIRLTGGLLSVLLLAGCSGDGNAPARAVEDYLDALASKDADRLSLLSCADWEDDAQMTLDSFAAVDVALEGVSCEVGEMEADSALVNCTGAIVTTYEGESQELDLTQQTFEVVQQSGEWLVCEVQ